MEHTAVALGCTNTFVDIRSITAAGFRHLRHFRLGVKLGETNRGPVAT